MNTQMLEPVTTQFPVHYRHEDDGTACMHPATCVRDLYVRAGTAWRHLDDNSPCTTPRECSHIGRDAYLPGGASE